jgi:hypothetical protein
MREAPLYEGSATLRFAGRRGKSQPFPLSRGGDLRSQEGEEDLDLVRTTLLVDRGLYPLTGLNK